MHTVAYLSFGSGISLSSFCFSSFNHLMRSNISCSCRTKKALLISSMNSPGKQLHCTNVMLHTTTEQFYLNICHTCTFLHKQNNICQMLHYLSTGGHRPHFPYNGSTNGRYPTTIFAKMGKCQAYLHTIARHLHTCMKVSACKTIRQINNMFTVCTTLKDES
jgi:hypothetical protein